MVPTTCVEERVVIDCADSEAPWTLPVLAAPILLSLVVLMLTWREVG